MYFMSYRRYYLWRARYRYYTRNIDAWSVLCTLLLVCMALMTWGYWRTLNVPPPRIHPQAAELHVQSLIEETIHHIAVVRHADASPGLFFDSHADIRASTVRTLKVRQVLQDAAALQLQADMYADIADYITATSACFPYGCEQVIGRIEQLRRAGQRSAAINAALLPVLDVPADMIPNLEGERQRVESGWADDFNDVQFHTWILRDVQQVHAHMMSEYPHRAPMPWLARLLTPAQSAPGF